MNRAYFLFAVCFIITGCTSSAMRKPPEESLSAPPAVDSTISPVFSLCPEIFCSCACDDPFDPRVMLSSGFFAGQCLNTCEQRSVLPLPAADAVAKGYFSAAERSYSTIFAVNISHAENEASPAFFCAAKIPLDGLEDVILQVEHAGGLQAHAQLRFTFTPDNPVVLVNQRTDSERKHYLVRDLNFSVEAIAPPGVPYKGDWGFKSEYFQSYRLTSQIIRARKMILEDRHRVWQYRIKLTPKEKQDILQGVLTLGQKGAYVNRYHTVQNNCIIELFRVIDANTHQNWFNRFRASMHQRTLFLPTRAPQQLKFRGLSSRHTGSFHLQNLETELGWEKYVDQSLYK